MCKMLHLLQLSSLYCAFAIQAYQKPSEITKKPTSKGKVAVVESDYPLNTFHYFLSNSLVPCKDKINFI